MEYYVHLSSSNNTIYPNTFDNFTCNLDSPLYLEGENWSVALIHLSFLSGKPDLNQTIYIKSDICEETLTEYGKKPILRIYSADVYKNFVPKLLWYIPVKQKFIPRINIHISKAVDKYTPVSLKTTLPSVTTETTCVLHFKNKSHNEFGEHAS